MTSLPVLLVAYRQFEVPVGCRLCED